CTPRTPRRSRVCPRITGLTISDARDHQLLVRTLMRTLKRMFGVIIVGATVVVTSASMTWAQDQDPVAEAQGPQPGRDYFSQAPHESVDPLTGNLLLQFTDVVLPGNAGRDLRFIRTYSLKGAQPWSFGLAGMVMFVSDVWPLQ